jgi:hypothetical protein
MHHSLIKIIKWFCRRLTFNELASAVIIFHEILSGYRKNIPLKPNEKSAHYRQFRVDQRHPLPPPDKPPDLIDWKILKKTKSKKQKNQLNRFNIEMVKKRPQDANAVIVMHQVNIYT